MQTRTLGRTDLRVSEITLGTWGLASGSYGPVRPARVEETIREALEAGVTTFDCAPVWGDSEAQVGAVLRDAKADAVVITRGGARLVKGKLLQSFTAEALVASLLYVGYFLKELVKANLQMAAIVLSPRLPVEPAIVATRVRLTHPVARLLLANSITLTPGTLSVEMKGDTLYVHWVVAKGTDVETATREIVAGFERYLEKMYD